MSWGLPPGCKAHKPSNCTQPSTSCLSTAPTGLHVYQSLHVDCLCTVSHHSGPASLGDHGVWCASMGCGVHHMGCATRGCGKEGSCVGCCFLLMLMQPLRCRLLCIESRLCFAALQSYPACVDWVDDSSMIGSYSDCAVWAACSV